jgi:hypothetical protein
MADADEYAMVAADRAGAPDLAAGELVAVAQPCAEQTADGAPAMPGDWRDPQVRAARSHFGQLPLHGDYDSLPTAG